MKFFFSLRMFDDDSRFERITNGWCSIYRVNICTIVSFFRVKSIGHFRVLLCLCFKTSLSAKPFIWKWVLHAVSFSCKSISHLDSLWNRGTRELGNGLLISCHTLLSRHQYFQQFAHLSFGYFPYWQTLLLYAQSDSSVDAALIQGNGKIQF